jgi:hypothetical protein
MRIDRTPATLRGGVLLLTTLLAAACTVSEPSAQDTRGKP